MTASGSNKVANGKVHILAKETGIAWLAQKPQVGADVVMAGTAKLAVIAVYGRLENRLVARRPAGNARPRLHYRPGRFMAEDHWVLARCISNATI
jgi:hypothetical protein